MKLRPKFSRGLRTTLAFFVVALLVVLLLTVREDLESQEATLAADLTAMSWVVSELVFEAQRLNSVIHEFLTGDKSRVDVIISAELLWSRVEILKESKLQHHSALSELAGRLHGLLSENDHLIYDAPLMESEKVKNLRLELTKLTGEIRAMWIGDFIPNSQSILASTRTDLSDRRHTLEVLMVVCLAILSIYMIVELRISQRAHTRERGLRQAAMAANEAKSMFLANVSHEVRTPLNGVIGMAQELAETPLSRDQAGLVDVIIASGNLLLTTINDVLDLSKVESGRIELETCVINLHARLEQTVSTHRPAARSKGIDLAITVEETVPEWVIGDPARLSQVINNLLSNAIKFTEEGSVRLRLEGRANEHGQLSNIRLEVSDTGQGIAASAQEKVFLPFSQEDSSTSRRHGGTGLGLTISREICRLMNGDLTLYSSVGRGSVFTANLQLELPDTDTLPAVDVAGMPVALGAAKADPDSNSAPAKNTAPAGNTVPTTPITPAPTPCDSPKLPSAVGKAAATKMPLAMPKPANTDGPVVLLVDDSAINRMVMTRFIGAKCSDLVEAVNGLEAVDAAKSQHFDVILMDMQMPEMDGLEATRHIRAYEAERSGQRRVPIFAVTANVMTHQVTEYLENGLDGVVAKPVQKSEILDLLDRQPVQVTANSA